MQDKDPRQHKVRLFREPHHINGVSRTRGELSWQKNDRNDSGRRPGFASVCADPKACQARSTVGGKYRIIDFPLSNCVNSDIDTVGILTQYQPLVLNEYVGNGQPWDLDRLHGGVHVLPPYQQASGSDWYKGTANAIYQNISFIDRYDPKYCIILSGDQICKQDYSDFLRFHKEKNAEFSVAVMEVPWSEASRFG